MGCIRVEDVEGEGAVPEEKLSPKVEKSKGSAAFAATGGWSKSNTVAAGAAALVEGVELLHIKATGRNC